MAAPLESQNPREDQFPLVSYHGCHSSEYCAHAASSLEEILDAYVARGYRYIGVTEHIPSLEGFLYPEEELTGAGELSLRFDRLMARRPELHRKYDRFFADFRIGFETEFYGPDPLERINGLIDRYAPEIVVASVHHVKDIPIDYTLEEFRRAVDACGSLEALFAAYYDEQYELIQSLARYTKRFPVILGHMDLIKIFQRQAVPDYVPGPAIWERIERNVRAGIGGGLVFEINGRGIQKGVGAYPSADILALIARLGGQVTVGEDAHSVDDVGRNEVRKSLGKTELTFFDRHGGSPYRMVCVSG